MLLTCFAKIQFGLYLAQVGACGKDSHLRRQALVKTYMAYTHNRGDPQRYQPLQALPWEAGKNVTAHPVAQLATRICSPTNRCNSRTAYFLHAPNPFHTIYDPLNRLKDATENVTPTGGSASQSLKQTFTFDRYGNRRFDEANTTMPASFANPAVTNPTISPNTNRLTSTGYSFDAAGNTTRDAEDRKFTFDAENKQVKVEALLAGTNTVTGTIGEYYYDGDGKRVKKYVPPSGSDPGETTVFVYDAGGKLVAEYSTVVASEQDAKVAYLTNDHLGSPRINTDANGTVTARHDYHPFGEEIAASQRTAGLRYADDSVRKQFTGYERDNEVNLDFAEARYYNSQHGRFTSVDPIMISKERLLDPQAINLYAYVRNNPLAYIDPTGEYFVGTDGKRVEYEIKDRRIVFTSNNVTKDLQRMADLVNKSGSEKAFSQFGGLANNDTMLHFEFAKGEGNYGLHRPHDKDGNILEWDSANGKFNGDPAYIKDKDGNSVYREATISIYEENIENSLSGLQKDPSIKDPKMTKEDFVVATFGHEGDHDLNVKAIATIKKRQDGGERYNVQKKVEKPAYDVTFKILKEIKKARGRN